MPKEKLVLGVPFYARPSWKEYRDLVEENTENAYRDYAPGENLDSYYNGINTIKEKTRLATRKASGMMVFDMNEDAVEEYSLLKAIDDTLLDVYSLSTADYNDKIYFIVNNRELVFTDTDGLGVPFIDENNRTLVPVRKGIENIGAEVTYNQITNTVIAKKENIIIEIPIGKKQLKVNGKTQMLDTKAVIKNSRSYAPLKAIYEAFNYDVEWHSGSRTIIIKQE